MTIINKVINEGDILNEQALTGGDLSDMAAGMVGSPVQCSCLNYLGRVTAADILGPQLTLTMEVYDDAIVTSSDIRLSIGDDVGNSRVITSPPNWRYIR